jgi:TolA-binding protein
MRPTPEELADAKLAEEHDFAQDALHRVNGSVATLDAQVQELQVQIVRLLAQREKAVKRQEFLKGKLQPVIDAWEEAQPKGELLPGV